MEISIFTPFLLKELQDNKENLILLNPTGVGVQILQLVRRNQSRSCVRPHVAIEMFDMC